MSVMTDSKPYLVPDWPTPAGVRAIMTTRAGGVSRPPFDTLNLGAHVADAPEDVAKNRAMLADWMNSTAGPVTPVFLDQVHGTRVVDLDDDTVVTGTRADACIATKPGRACVIMVADCMPVLMAVPGGVAAAHAGWRGLAGGVLETTLKRLLEATGAARQEVVAWLGPCIGRTAFEVGPDVYEAFCAVHPDNMYAFESTDHGKWHADLGELGRMCLQRCGIGCIVVDGRCTYSDPTSFFSYRRDQKILGGTGRMAACIWLER